MVSSGLRAATFRALLLAPALALAACGILAEGEADYEYGDDSIGRNVEGKLLGSDGLSLRLGGSEGGSAAASPIAVNAFLWRASLDTLAFMPLASADPFGGVIITDWHTPPESPDERFKTTVYILSRELRADGLRVAVFRQARDRDGSWSDAALGADTATALENAILTRARELRVASVPQ